MMVEQMTAHGDKAHRPTNKPPIRCLQRLLFFRNEKIMFMLLGFEKMFVSLQCTGMCRDRVCDRVPPTGHRGVSHFYFTSFSMFSSMMQKNIRPEYFLLASANASTKAKYLGPGDDKKDASATVHLFETSIQGDKTWIIVKEYTDGNIILYSISDSANILKSLKKMKKPQVTAGTTIQHRQGTFLPQIYTYIFK